MNQRLPPFAILAAVALAAAIAGFTLRGCLAGGLEAAAAEPGLGRQHSPREPLSQAALPRVILPAQIRWIAAGGGGDPAYNEVSLEQDLALAQEVFGPTTGVLLHAGGGGVDGVRIRDERPVSPPPSDYEALIERLAELLDPLDRMVRYRPSELVGAGPATRQGVSDALLAGLRAASSEPLLFFFSGHGEQGPEPQYNTVHTWGGWGLSATDIAGLLEEARPSRPVVFVIAACFSGGFANLAFADADAEAGEAAGGRCGVFASTWDRESAGCDPDPDRGAQGGYSMHFLNALRGRDAAGTPLSVGEVDYDGDGEISILDAHTRARIASTSIDVPTTTSEAWLQRIFREESLRATGLPPREHPPMVLLPEEQAVIVALGARFGLDTKEAVDQRIEELDRRLDAAADRLDLRDEEVNDAWGRARIALLERWPVLHDPYHRDYARTIAGEHRAINRWFDDAREMRAWRDAQGGLEAPGEYLALEAEHAALLRLARAWQTAAMAARLGAMGGDAWRVFERLRACERTLPPTL